MLKILGWIILITLAIIGFLALCVYFSPDLEAGQSVDLSIISQIESNNNPTAYNKQSGAIGLYQVTPVCLADYNRFNIIYNDGKYIHIEADWALEKLYDPQFNKIVAEWYLNTRIPQLLKYYKILDTIDNRLWAYNAGIGNLLKGIMPKETQNYLKRYQKLANVK